MLTNKTNKILYKYYHNLTSIGNNKPIMGLAIILLNIFSKYIEIKLSKTQEAYIKSVIGREILIFMMAFVATNDIILSILLTAAFLILSNTIFNEKSKFCIIPDKYKQLDDVIDTNKDNNISKEEIDAARKILENANKYNN